MAWDLNARLANNADITADAQGTWTKIHDVPDTGSFTPDSDTMLIGDWANLGLVEFRLWIRGVDLGGDVDPTSVNLVVDIEEADDSSGTNARPVCRFRMGTGAATDTPSGYAYTVAADSTTDAQFVACGTVSKPYLRYNADVTLNAGTNPTVSFNDVTIYARGVGFTLEKPPASVAQ